MCDTEDFVMQPQPALRRSPRPRKVSQKALDAREDATAAAAAAAADQPRAAKRKTSRPPAAAKKGTAAPPAAVEAVEPSDPAELARAYPDAYHARIEVAGEPGPLGAVNAEHKLTKVRSLPHPGAIWGMAWSPDYSLLATASTLGSVCVWGVDDWSLLQELRDPSEKFIEEFYVVKFLPDGKRVIAGGKLKDRLVWDEDDDDNRIEPSPLKIFDIVSGQVVMRLEGHSEEILCLKLASFKGENYFLSCGQDGMMYKWHMNSDYTELLGRTSIKDDNTNIVMTVSFVPNCGNLYFVAACDDCLRIYDFERECLLKVVPEIYTSFCDCAKFVFPDGLGGQSPNEHYLLSRGVELVLENEETGPELARHNVCHLWKVTVEPKAGGDITVDRVAEFAHPEYFSNCWTLKLTSNGRYAFVPGSAGKIFVWNLATGQMVACVQEHQRVEVRDLLLHPYRPILLSSADDSTINVLSYASS